MNRKCLIVAEISGNHNGDKHRALDLIKAASEAGADAVKLQTYKPEDFVISDYKLAEGLWKGRNLKDLYEEAKTPYEWHEELFEFGKALKLEVFSSPFSEEAVDFLERLKTPRYKIASFEITYLPLIAKVSRTGKPIIISTGLGTQQEIRLAVDTARKNGAKDITLLKCVSKYPAPLSDCNLRGMELLAEYANVSVGLSDHTKDTVVPAASVAMGATVIEKHLDLEDRLGVDGGFSLTPKEFTVMVNNIRKVEQAMGEKLNTINEANREFIRKEDTKTGKWLRVLPDSNYEEVKVQSSNIERVGYKLLDSKLVLTFKKGNVYEYDNVEISVFEDMLKAESIGKFFHAKIKDKYKCTKLV